MNSETWGSGLRSSTTDSDYSYCWGFRGILRSGQKSVDIPQDRQGFGAHMEDVSKHALNDVLNAHTIPWINETVRDAKPGPHVHEGAWFSQDIGVIRARIRVYGGYVYGFVYGLEEWFWPCESFRDTKYSFYNRQTVPNGQWISEHAIPDLGDWVTVNLNALGRGRVVGFFEEHEIIGVQVWLTNPPEWWKEQNPGINTCTVFGCDLKTYSKGFIMNAESDQLESAAELASSINEAFQEAHDSIDAAKGRLHNKLKNVEQKAKKEGVTDLLGDFMDDADDIDRLEHTADKYLDLQNELAEKAEELDEDYD